MNRILKYNMVMPYVIWVTGMPGSGKSTLSTALKERVPDAVVLRMDDLRRIVTPEPDYSDMEREHVYRTIVYTARTIYELGHNVIIDATGNRRYWRELARQEIPDFIEVFVKCRVEICIEREKIRTERHGAPKDIYDKGSKGAPVPGVNVQYEDPEQPEIVIDAEKEKPEEGVERIIKLIKD
jgi:adenylylsulfate kinase